MKTITLALLALSLGCNAPAGGTPETRTSDPSAAVGAIVPIEAVTKACRPFAVNNAGRFPDTLEMLVIKDENGQAYPAGGLVAAAGRMGTPVRLRPTPR